MDILLISPSMTVEERYGNRGLGDVGGNLPPLGIALLASYLNDHGFDAGVLDASVLDMGVEDILLNIERIRPKAIGLSSLTPTFHRSKTLASHVRRSFPEMLIILGGHHATILPREILSGHSPFDMVVRGEGEETLRQVMEEFKGQRFSREEFLSDRILLSGIPGIGYRDDDGSVRLTPARAPIKNLDALPPPAWDLLPMGRYLPLPNQYKQRPVVHMVLIRGCPFECSFCSNPAIYGRHVRFKSPGRAVTEIEHVVHAYGVKEISFWDDTFTVNRKWVEEVCTRLIRRNLGITWSCYASVNTVDLELLRLMKKAGCWNVFYGFESGSQRILNTINKGITLDDIRRTARWTHDAGLEMRASFMVGLPGETPQDAQTTLDFALELDPEYAQFSFTTPFPGTSLYGEAAKYGKLNDNLSDYYGWAPVFVPFGYRDEQQVLETQRRMTRKFYFRPRYFLKMIKLIRSMEDVRRYIKGFRIAIKFSKSPP